ncbi:MAG: CBS domain-containing protein [Thermodesulfovibrionales bacterium]
MDIIVSHINADFDSLASMVGAKKLYPDARLVFPGSQEKKVRDFIAAFQPVEISRPKDVDLSKVTRLILVDTKSPERIGIFSELLKRKDVAIHIYDHHPRTEGDIKGTVEVIEDVGATATIFVDILRSKKIPITPMEATVLCLGIYEETGSLLFPTTTERDMLASAFLLKKGASLKIVSNFIRTDLTKEELDLLNELLQSSIDMDINGIRVKIVKAVREEYAGDAAHIAHRIMDMEDIDGLVLLLATEGRNIVIGRSRVPELDISEVMRELGGGGHPSAASASVKGVPLELLEERVKDLVRNAIRSTKTAKDIMTTPVITIPSDSTVKEAESMMTRYGVNVLPVVRDGKYSGILTREIVEKALFHGFKKSKVYDFTTTDALTVTLDTPIREIEALMVEQNQRFMPVIEGERIVGAITRTDILRTLYEDILRRSRLTALSTGKQMAERNLSNIIKDRFPPSVVEMLRLAGEVADRMGFVAYLVGGSVRDLIMGHENLDIDIVIEGDGIAFAREFSKRLDARLRTHERFGTAQVFTKELKIDVATARTEYYESPGALPTVETSSIKKDLYRRDFTINTLAIKLNPKDFGLLIDFFGGQRDIREKTIRVLHNLSFIEDPTRAFRAIRFSERFGFKLSRHTETLIRSALRMNLFEKLSGTRIYEELILTFHETEPVRTIKRLSEYGLLKVVHPDISFDKRMESILQSLHDTLSWFNLLFLKERPDIGILYLMALLSGLDDKKRGEAFIRLSIPEQLRERIETGLLKAKDLIRILPLRDTVEIYNHLSNLSIETLLFTMAVTTDDEKKKEISHFLLNLRQIRPLTKGEDLMRIGIKPGPIYSEILRKVLEEKLKGKLKTKEEEIEFIRERYKSISLGV